MRVKMQKIKLYPASGGLPEFVLTRKNMKRIHIRIADDGSICVSAPMRTSLSDIRRVIAGHIDWINAVQNRKQQQRSVRPQACSGGNVIVAGRSYPLSIKTGSRSSSKLIDGTICLTISDPENSDLVKEAIEHFLRKQAGPLLEASLKRMYPLVEPFDAPLPEVKIRRMTSRWGSCNVKTRVITLNLYLARAPEELIDSVMLHELIHLVNFPHDARFHAISASLMPDYRQRAKALNALDIIY